MAKRPLRKARVPVAMPDAIAAGATFEHWCAALRARITARTAGEQAIAEAECARIREWYGVNGVDPEGVWGVGPWVLDGDTVKPRAVYDREMETVDTEWRREGNGGA